MLSWLSGGAVDPPTPVPVPGLTVIVAPSYARIPSNDGCGRQPDKPSGSVVRKTTLVAREPAVGHPVRTGRIDTKSFHFVFLVRGEVALEPEPLGLVVVVALPRQDVRAGAVADPPVARNHARAAGEVIQRVLHRT